MSDFLAEMADVSLVRARTARQEANVSDLQARVASAPPPLTLDVSARGFDVIAEVKLASPSEGPLVQPGSGGGVVSALARSYASRGAAAVSVLTEPSRFAGSLEHLESVAKSVSTPVLRKDFLVDPIQVLEARAAGASGVLLIARLLPRELLVEMTDLAISHGLFVLVEVFDISDLETAVSVFDRDVLVGVNCRDLATLGIDEDRFRALAPHLPDHLPAVAESGLSTPDQVAEVVRLGYRMALVGSSLVSDADPASKLVKLLTAGRQALAGAS